MIENDTSMVYEDPPLIGGLHGSQNRFKTALGVISVARITRSQIECI